MRVIQPRVPPLPESEWSDDVSELLPKTATVSGGPPLNVFTTLARHPRLFKRWMVFGNHVLFKSTLPARERELIILRTGWACRSPYEVHQHTRIGLESGLTREEIDRVALGAAAWSGRDALLLAAVDELVGDHLISDATWRGLNESFSETQIIDLIFAVGQYTLVSMALNSLGVQIEERDP